MALESDNSVIYQNKLLASYFAAFEEMRQTGEYCDVTFKVKGQLLRAHRNIMAAAIPYFRTALRSENQSEQSGSAIEVKELDPDTLETFINFAYGKKVVINDENFRRLYLGAEFLQVDEMREVCFQFLEQKLCPSNVFGIRTVSERSNITRIVERCDLYIRENFDECSQNEEFSHLPVSALKQLISKDDLRVENEEKVFEAVMRWVKESPPSRQASLPELLMDVRLALLTPGYLVQQVANEEMVKKSLICRDLLEEAKTYHLLPEKQLSSLRVLPRCYKGSEHAALENADVEGVYVISSRHSYPLVEFYDFEKRIWTNVHFENNDPTDNNRNYKSVSDNKKLSILTEAGNKIYVFRDRYLDELDLKTKKWRIVYCDVSYDVVVKHCSDIYICGRNATGQWCITVFDPTNYGITVVAQASLNIEDPGIASLEDNIYVLGGLVRLERNIQNTNAVITYNTSKKIWTRLPPMLTKRSRPGAAVLNGKVYVCGGYQGYGGDSVSLFLSAAEVYCASTRKWISIAPMFSTGKMLSSVFYMGKLHVFQSSNGLLTVDMYDPETAKFECYEVMSRLTDCNKDNTEVKAVAVFRT